MKGKLHITAPGDLKLIDDVESRTAQHLVFLISQGLGGSHHNTVPGMYPHRVNILHIADSDTVSGAVPHDLVLDLLPARDTALHQHLSHPGQAQSVFQDAFQLRLVVGDPAAGAS